MKKNNLFTPAIGMNQLTNIRNPFQSDRKKVLCVCSAGLLRSTTLAAYLTFQFGYNVRNCGTSQEYALIPISEALLLWADEIHVVKDQAHYIYDCLKELPQATKKVIIIDIPDEFEAFDTRLFKILEAFYENYSE